MVLFKNVKYKNILSVGNTFIEVDLCKNPTTLITGHNGAGKTTILEAIVYCLYGKPYRKVNLSGLINNINKKKMEVIVEFEYQSDLYQVHRYQKPNKFEIYKNNKLINIDSKSRNYQDIINRILGDFKLFTQTVILNKSKFTPFLSLSMQDRRKIVDDMLDIEIFTQMSINAKNLLSDNKNKLIELEYIKDNIESKIKLTNDTLSQLNNTEDCYLDNIKLEINDTKNKIDIQKNKLLEIKNGMPDDKNDMIRSLNDDLLKIQFEGNSLSKEIKIIDKEIKFYKETDICTTCSQNISIEKKEKVINQLTENKKNILISIENKMKSHNDIQSKIKYLQSEQKKYILWKENANNEYSKFNQLQHNLENLENSLCSLNKKENKQIEQQENVLNKLNVELKNNQILLDEEHKNKEINTIFVESLKDNGIKTSVIELYLPVLNEKINEYLEQMEFYVGIELDSTFNESFYTPGRESFNYHNLSDGQKSRVDLAILLSWLYVAELKSSLHTNLLFLDEILSAVDSDGVRCFMNLIKNSFSDKNLFVIEQRNDLIDNFRGHISFKLNDGFTEFNE